MRLVYFHSSVQKYGGEFLFYLLFLSLFASLRDSSSVSRGPVFFFLWITRSAYLGREAGVLDSDGQTKFSEALNFVLKKHFSTQSTIDGKEYECFLGAGGELCLFV